MLSQSCVFRKSKNFTSDFGIRIPPTVPINHYSRSLQTETDTWKTSKTRVLSCHPMLMAFNDFTRSLLWTRWFTHSDWRCSFFQKKEKQRSTTRCRTRNKQKNNVSLHSFKQKHALVRLPTTSFLTTAMLVYAIGAGITAAAGTRLALQWILDKVFTLFSWRLANDLPLKTRNMRAPSLFIVTTSLH